MKYEYSKTNKRVLVCDEKSVKPVHLLLEGSFEEMGKLGFLCGSALKDYQDKINLTFYGLCPHKDIFFG